MTLINKLTTKILNVILNSLVIVLSSMSLLGILFMIYQIVFNGVTGDFGIYR